MTMETKDGEGNGDDAPSLGEESLAADDSAVAAAAAVEDPETIVQHFTWDSDFEKDNNSQTCLTASDETGGKLLPTIFRWNAEAERVDVSGSYDNWKTKMPLVRSQGVFYNVVEVPEGTHQYKYRVDGEWKCHPNEPMIDNGIGSRNNIMTIHESDCDIADILTEPEGVTVGEFSQYIPAKDPGSGFQRCHPPAVPQHLLETILHKEVSAHCDPTLIAEPNHVVLNHLYTLSIKDGVMVLSATHRYRKKYITTLLYRPIIK